MILSQFTRSVSGLILIAFLLFLTTGAAADDEGSTREPAPWRIDNALPEWASLSVKHRTRYEFLGDEFRATGPGSPGDREILVFRTLVHARLRIIDGLWIGAELEDSRAEVNGNTLLNTTIVNAVELLRGYIELTRSDVLGGKLTAQAGRITMDLGTRRFVARNRYRNTINGFTGIDLGWKNESGSELRAFWTLPVQRQPGLFSQLRDNKIQYDDEDFDLQFWGVYASTKLTDDDRGEIFLLGLHEQDEPNRRTRKRELFTPGFRLFRKPRTDRVDYTVEAALQFGRSRSAASAARLDHFAYFTHLEVGYSFDALWSPRLAFQYDFASGDEDPTDGDNNRFDTLFGARRFDFGPTGIYGPFARSNLNTPGVRLQLKPTRKVSTFLAFRSYWLADRSDTWTTSGVRDARGKSGAYLGSQFEIRVRWDVLPDNLRLESGYAHLIDGEFIQNAPNSNQPGDLNYVYVQAAITL